MSAVAYVACKVSPEARKMKGFPLLSTGRPGQLAGDIKFLAGVELAKPSFDAEVIGHAAIGNVAIVYLHGDEMRRRAVVVRLNMPKHFDPLAPGGVERLVGAGGIGALEELHQPRFTA